MELNTPKELLIWEVVRFLEKTNKDGILLQLLSDLAAGYTSIIQKDLPSNENKQSEQTTTYTPEQNATDTPTQGNASESSLRNLGRFLNLRTKILNPKYNISNRKDTLQRYHHYRDQLLVLLLNSNSHRIKKQVFDGLHEDPKNKAIFESIIRQKHPVYEEDHIVQAYNDLFVQVDRKIKAGTFYLKSGTLLNTFLFDIGIKKYIDKLPKPPVDHSQLHLCFRPYGMMLLERRHQLTNTPASKTCRNAAAILVKLIKKGSIAPPLKHALINYYFEIIENLVKK